MKRAKKPTYYQMFDWLAAKYGYKFMMELHREDRQEQAAAVEKAFLAASNKEQDKMNDDERTAWAEKVAKYSRVLGRILTKCTYPAGEDYPAGTRACIWCGLVEASSAEFHKPDCPVIEARQMIARDFYK